MSSACSRVAVPQHTGHPAVFPSTSHAPMLDRCASGEHLAPPSRPGALLAPLEVTHWPLLYPFRSATRGPVVQPRPPADARSATSFGQCLRREAPADSRLDPARGVAPCDE